MSKPSPIRSLFPRRPKPTTLKTRNRYLNIITVPENDTTRRERKGRLPAKRLRSEPRMFPQRHRVAGNNAYNRSNRNLHNPLPASNNSGRGMGGIEDWQFYFAIRP